MAEPQPRAAWAPAHSAVAMARSIARWVGAVDAMTLDVRLLGRDD